jgi:hypothetical protein
MEKRWGERPREPNHSLPQKNAKAAKNFDTDFTDLH